MATPYRSLVRALLPLVFAAGWAIPGSTSSGDAAPAESAAAPAEAAVLSSSPSWLSWPTALLRGNGGGGAPTIEQWDPTEAFLRYEAPVDYKGEEDRRLFVMSSRAEEVTRHRDIVNADSYKGHARVFEDSGVCGVQDTDAPCCNQTCSGLSYCTALNGRRIEDKYFPTLPEIQGSCFNFDERAARLEIWGDYHTNKPFRDTAECRQMVLDYTCIHWATMFNVRLLCRAFLVHAHEGSLYRAHRLCRSHRHHQTPAATAPPPLLPSFFSPFVFPTVHPHLDRARTGASTQRTHRASHAAPSASTSGSSARTTHSTGSTSATTSSVPRRRASAAVTLRTSPGALRLLCFRCCLGVWLACSRCGVTALESPLRLGSLASCRRMHFVITGGVLVVCLLSLLSWLSLLLSLLSLGGCCLAVRANEGRFREKSQDCWVVKVPSAYSAACRTASLPPAALLTGGVLLAALALHASP